MTPTQTVDELWGMVLVRPDWPAFECASSLQSEGGPPSKEHDMEFIFGSWLCLGCGGSCEQDDAGLVHGVWKYIRGKQAPTNRDGEPDPLAIRALNN